MSTGVRTYCALCPDRAAAGSTLCQECSELASEVEKRMNDSRLGQMRALIDDARALATEMQEEGGSGPVDTRRLGSVRSYLNSALSTLDWFDKPYPDERS